jgi:ParB family chromosome partitioning protein
MGKTAFDFKRGNSWFAPPEDVVIIGLDTKDGPEHKLYKDDIHDPLDEAFVKTVEDFGVIQPVSVRKNGERAEVTWGRTRIRAAREANRRRKKRGAPPLLVKIVLEKAEEKVLQAMSIVENAARKIAKPVDEAREMQKVMRSGYDEDDLATMFACSVQKVRKRLALLTLSPKLISAVEKGKASATAVLTLQSLSHEDQATKLEDLLSHGPPDEDDHDREPGRAVKEANGTSNGQKNGKAASKPKRPTADAVRVAAGRRVQPRVKQIKIMLEHGGLDQATAEEYLRWMVGLLPASKVKGLTAALRAAGLETA